MGDDDILGSSMGDDIGEFPDNYDDAHGGDGLDGFLPQDDEGKFPVGVGEEELLEQARTNIEKFYSERKQKQESIKAQNKENEQGYFSEMKDLMQHGAPWEKVGRLVNLAPKANEKPGTSKVNRMRQLLIQLKNEKKNN